MPPFPDSRRIFLGRSSEGGPKICSVALELPTLAAICMIWPDAKYRTPERRFKIDGPSGKRIPAPRGRTHVGSGTGMTGGCEEGRAGVARCIFLASHWFNRQ